MTNLLASEGGYQAFTLGSAEKDWLYFALATGFLALIVALGLMRDVLAAGTGTPLMREIAAAIQEGAEAFLKRQFRVIGIIVIPLAVLVFFTATKVVEPCATDTWRSPSPSPASTGRSPSSSARPSRARPGSSG